MELLIFVKQLSDFRGVSPSDYDHQHSSMVKHGWLSASITLKQFRQDWTTKCHSCFQPLSLTQSGSIALLKKIANKTRRAPYLLPRKRSVCTFTRWYCQHIKLPWLFCIYRLYKKSFVTQSGSIAEKSQIANKARRARNKYNAVTRTPCFCFLFYTLISQTFYIFMIVF